MGIFSRIFRRKSAVNKSARAATPGLRYSMPTWLRGDYSLHNSELLFAAVSRLSNSISAMPISLYQKTRPVKNELADLVGFAPNPNMTASQFMKTMETCRCTYGNCYALKVLDTDLQLERLDILDPLRVQPVLLEGSEELYYRIRPERGDEYYIHNYYVVHIPFLSTNGYMGLNPVSVLFDTLSYAENIQKFSKDQLEKGINAAVVVEAPATLGQDQQDKAIADLQNVYKRSGGNILFLESGLSAKTLNLSPVDTKLFEVEKITRSKVAMVYGIPPHMLGDYSTTSFSSQEQQMLEFLSLTMLPIVTAYEQEFTKKLLTYEQRKRGQAFKLSIESLLRADAQTKADVNQKAIRGGWRTPNEARASDGYEPRPEGNMLLASRDLTTLDFVVNNPEAIFGIRNTQEANIE